jgi:hypothetical protein
MKKNNNKNKSAKRWDGVDRRNGKNYLVKAINVFTVLSWVVFFLAIVISHYGRPETSNIIIRFHDIQIRDYWIPHLKVWLLILLGCCTTVSVVSLIANQLRKKRRSDSLRFSLYFLSFICAVIFFNIV